jgi:ADP-heptose:LPS heptosyltransferase
VSAPKILALSFKYLGDAVFMTPALRALREHFPQSEIHVLVPEETAPLLQHIPWLTRVWAMPRRRGSANLRQTWPIIRALRREKFDRSVDFCGNDRGALLSFLIGARRRLARNHGGGFLGRKFCYTERVAPEKKPQHELEKLLQILSAWDVPTPSSMAMEIRVDPVIEKATAAPFPARTVLCHVTTSNDRKEWPVAHWVKLHQLSRAAGIGLVFSAGPNEREQRFLAEITRMAPEATVLPASKNLGTFLVYLKQAAVFVSGDTGPLHFSAALGVRTVGLFGSSSAVQSAPLGEKHMAFQGSPCTCDDHAEHCHSATRCIAAITPEMVFERIKTQLAAVGKI